MFKSNKPSEDTIQSLVKNSGLFDSLTDSEVKDFIKFVHIREYAAGEKIFAEKTIGLCCYLICSGSVQIVSTEDGNTVVIREFGKGDHFSEIHLFTEKIHTVSCVANELTKLLIWTKPDIEDLVKVKPKIGVKIAFGFLEFFGEQLDVLYKENVELKQKLNPR